MTTVAAGTTVPTAFDRTVARRGPSIALIHGHGAERRAWSFDAIEEWSRAVALRLLDAGVRPGDRCALGLPNSPELVIGLLGILRAGATVVPLNSLATADEAGYVLRHAEVSMALLAEGLREIGSAVVPRVAGLRDAVLREPDPSDSPQGRDLPVAAPEQTALLVYTSGTTGRPKGVLLPHRALVSNLAAIAELWGWSESDRLLLTLPCFHLHGLALGCTAPFVVGSSVVLRDGFRGEDLPGDLEKCRATMFFGVPTMYARLVALPPEVVEAADLSRMRLWVSGSAPLSPAVAGRFEQRFGRKIVERFGMSEGGFMLSTRPGDERPGAVGWPVPGVECRIVGEGGDGVGGELQVRGTSLFSGYWRDPEATRLGRVEGWFRTGDLATRDPDGAIRIVGRVSTDVIKCRGYKIGAVELEQCLTAHPDVSEAAVVGVPDEDQGQRVVAFVIPRPGATCDAGELAAFMRQSLAGYKIPSRFEFRPDLPRTGPGKVAKRVLIEEATYSAARAPSV